jgi:hypothetical protein
MPTRANRDGAGRDRDEEALRGSGDGRDLRPARHAGVRCARKADRHPVDDGAGAARLSGPAYWQASGFDASYQGVKGNDTVRVQVICMQNGSVVYGDNTVLTGSPSTVWFTLGQPRNGTSVWTSGGASCRSDLYVVSGGNKVTFLAAVTFVAGG